MSFLADKQKRKKTIILLSVFFAISIIATVCIIYLMDYYPADNEAIGAYLPEGSAWKEEPDGRIVFNIEGATVGFIFYPGGKVEHRAYIPLMQACASEGILCVIPEMPFNLAVLDINAAAEICDDYPDIEKWYIGGHSLGGSMAASYLAENADDFEGLILLGAYSTADISDTELEVLSVYGSEDKILDRANYNKYKANLPEDYRELVIEGGCHAYFGMYGFQEGDGTPTVTNEEQIQMTKNAIASMILTE